MIVLTLEGLPHSGKCAILRRLMQRCPEWRALNVAPSPSPSATWSSPCCQSSHALFSALLRKLKALAGTPAEASRVVVMNCPWFEYLPKHAALQDLAASATAHLLGCLRSHVRLHIMVLLHVHPDETFEQMVCCGNPFWNGTSIADVRDALDTIRHAMDAAKARALPHPFECETHVIPCPQFFEENEVVLNGMAEAIVDLVGCHAARATA